MSLFDYTGEALKPWAEAGFECFAYDIQHTGAHRDGISFLLADLDDSVRPCRPHRRRASC